MEVYVDERNKDFNELRKLIYEYDNSVNEFEENRFDFFNYSQTLKAVRVWDIITTELTPDKRNIFLLFETYDHDYKKLMEYFHSKAYSTLRVIISDIRKDIRNRYNSKYSTI